MELPKGYISYSQIRQYQDCPRKYYYTYVKKIQAPINDKVYLGIKFHEAVEYYLKEKIEGRVPVKDRILEYFSNSFDHKLSAQDINWDIKPQETRKRGLAFVRHFMREIAPYTKPIMVEKEFSAHLPDIDITLKGVVDMVEEDFSITDFKTTTAKWSKSRIQSSYLQVVIYRYLFEQNFGDVISYLKFIIVYSKKATNIRHQEIAIRPGDVDSDFSRVFEIIKYAVDGIRGEVFFKNEGFACGFCPFKTICKKDTIQEPQRD